MKPNWRLLYFVFTMVFYTLSNASSLAARQSSIPKSHTEAKKDRRVFSKILSQVTRDMMGHSNPAIRIRANITLGRLSVEYYGIVPHTPLLEPLLHEKDGKVRWVAMQVLANFPVNKWRPHVPTRGTVRMFQKIMDTDRTLDFRRIAALALLRWGKLDKNSDKIWKYTLEMLQHENPEYRLYALQKLHESTELPTGKKPMTVYKLDTNVRKQLEEMAKNPKPSHELVRAVSSLWRGRPTPLDEWLDKEDYKVRQTGALALEPHALKDGGVSLDLLNTLRSDSSVKVRAAAAKAITGHPDIALNNDDIRSRREFSPKMQKRVWNALIETVRHDAPDVRASALLSLSNLKTGDANAWQVFTDATMDEDEKVRRAALMGVGRAIYLEWNESIHVVLMRQATNVDNSYRTRVRAIESLFLFNYWDDFMPGVLVNLLSEAEIRLDVVQAWGEYAAANPRAQRALYKAFKQAHKPTIRLSLAMALVRSGVSDNLPIKVLVDEGLNDALMTRYCAELLGRSGYRESFVIQGLMAKFRTSLDAVGSMEIPAFSILHGYFNLIGIDPKGSEFVAAYGIALLRLDKYNDELLMLLPKGIYCSWYLGQEFGSTYDFDFRYFRKNAINDLPHAIRQERQQDQ